MTSQKNEISQTVSMLRSASVDRFIKAIASLEKQPEVAEIRAIKDQIRDRIAELRPPRKLNITRIFCDPFEDMLRNSIEPQSSWIPRAAIQPCWRIVEGFAPPHLLLEVKNAIEATDVSDDQEITKLGVPLWQAASKAIAKVTADARSEDPAALELLDGDTAMIAHAETIAAACQVAPAIEELKAIFPNRPFKTLQLEQREVLRRELKRLSGAQQYDIRCVIHVVAHWTANPAEIFDLCVDLDLGKASPLGKLIFEQREKVVVGLLGDQVKTLESSLGNTAMDLSDCVELARVAADSISSAIDLIKERKNGGTNEGVARLREQLGSMVKDKVLGAATRALGAVWSNGKDAKDGAADGEAIKEAEAAARAMRKCGKLASKLGIESAILKKITASLETVRTEVTDQIAHLDNGAERAQLPAVRATLANATRILEILEGPERAFEFFREKQAKLRAHA